MNEQYRQAYVDRRRRQRACDEAPTRTEPGLMATLLGDKQLQGWELPGKAATGQLGLHQLLRSAKKRVRKSALRASHGSHAAHAAHAPIGG